MSLTPTPTSQPTASTDCDRPRSAVLPPHCLALQPLAAELPYRDHRAASCHHRCESCFAPRRTTPLSRLPSLEPRDASSSLDTTPNARPATSPSAPHTYPPPTNRPRHTPPGQTKTK